jgi:hypothetical protein
MSGTRIGFAHWLSVHAGRHRQQLRKIEWGTVS